MEDPDRVRTTSCISSCCSPATQNNMRLLTHNLLACHARSCQSTSNNFPLLLKDVQLEIIEAESNPTFIQGFLPKLDWNALVSTARSLGDSSLPDTGPDASQPLNDSELISALHHVLLEVSPQHSTSVPDSPSRTDLFHATSSRVFDHQIHVVEGNMICLNCQHVYQIRSGIPNMLLAEHEISK